MSRERDKILDGLLKETLAQRGAGAGACLDAETLAAWEDGGLDATAMTAVELHLSSCARCQALVATSMRGQEQATASAVSPPSTRSMWRWWLAPIAAGAAAVTLWMVVPAQRDIATAPPMPPQVATEAIKPETAEPPSAAAASAPAVDATPRQEARANEAKATERALPLRDAAAPKTEEARQDKAVAELAQQANPAAAAPPPVAPSAPVAEAPAPATAGLRARAQFSIIPFEVNSPDAAQRWRVTPAGVERSVDLGASWALVRAASGDTITAGVSPAPNVCWLIGNNGVVLISTNGSVFTRVVIPDGGNLRSISAQDGRSATVVNVAGRTFRTDDGGLTWR